MPLNPRSAVIIGPNALIREGLSRILERAGFRVISSAPALGQAPGVADVLSVSERPALVILDFADDFVGGMRQLRALDRDDRMPPTVVLSSRDDVGEMVAAFQAGANAFMVNVSNCDAFLSTLEFVMRGETILPPGVCGQIFHERSKLSRRVARIADLHDVETAHRESNAYKICDGFGIAIEGGASSPVTEVLEGGEPRVPTKVVLPRLSPRQESIVRCLVYGDTNKAIARKTNLSEATVKVHIKTILRKIHVRNRTQAAIWAVTHTLVEAEGSASSFEDANANSPIDRSTT